MDDISKSVRAMADLNKAGALRVRPPMTYAAMQAMAAESITVVMQKAADLDGNPYPDGVTPAVPDGWMAFKTAEGYRLVRGHDRQSLRGSANPNLWATQILDFEFAEGAEWKPEQIAAMNAMQSKDYTPAQVDAFAAALSVPLEPLYGAGTSGGGHSADTGKVVVVGVDMASGSDWTCYWPWPPAAAEIQVTPEMVAAGMKAFQFASPSNSLVGVYRAMAALSPVELVSAGELSAQRERDEALAKIERLKVDRNQQSKIRNDQAAEIAMLRQALAMAEKPGDHDYHGPLGKPDDRGQRVPIADAPHEQFHRAVGDVLAGKIIPKAREQMADALRRAPPDAPTSASTSKPMPHKALGLFGDPRRMGP